VYAMGGRPLVAVNLLAWPRGVLPFAVAREVLRGGLVHDTSNPAAGKDFFDNVTVGNRTIEAHEDTAP